MPASRVNIIRAAVLLTAALPGWGCDDRGDNAPGAGQPSATQAAAASEERSVTVRTLAPLLPARRTHVAVGPGGDVFWIQESGRGGGETAGVVFALGADGVPRATGLGARDVIAALGGDVTKASGGIQSLAGGADGAVYFTFVGGQGPRTLACVGRFDPAASKVEVLADTSRLASATGMGLSLALARLTVVASPDGKHVWLWARHSDQFALFRLAVSGAGAGGAKPPALDRPFRRVTTASGGEVTLTRDEQSLAVAADGSLVLLDVPAAALRRIDPATGAARDLLTLAGLPNALSSPASGAGGRVLLFAATGAEPILPRTAEQLKDRSRLPAGKELPALIVVDESAVDRVLPAAAFDVRGGDARPHSLRLQQLVGDGRGTYVAYDEASGELLRLRPAGE